MRLIVTCGCANTTKFAKDAFKILFKGEEVPDVIEHKTDSPYAYLLDFQMYNDTERVTVYNLLKGYKIC